VRPEPFCEENERENDRAEETGPGLLEGEEEKLPEEGIESAGGDMVLEPDADGVEARFCVGEQELGIGYRGTEDDLFEVCGVRFWTQKSADGHSMVSVAT
jgi:hypothetical protein